MARANTFNIHDAKTNFSRIVERASRGEVVIIAKAGKAVAKVSAVDAPKRPRRLGFLKGQIAVPRDFDRLFRKEIAELFETDE
jgi:prevent-host-death family protein